MRPPFAAPGRGSPGQDVRGSELPIGKRSRPMGGAGLDRQLRDLGLPFPFSGGSVRPPVSYAPAGVGIPSNLQIPRAVLLLIVACLGTGECACVLGLR